MGLSGSVFKIYGYFIIVFLFYFIINTNINSIRRICYLPLVALFIINISSLAKVTTFKFYKEEHSNPYSYKVKSLTFKDKKYSFVVWNSKDMNVISNELKENSERKGKDLFEGVAYKDDGVWLSGNNLYYIDLLNNILVFPL